MKPLLELTDISKRFPGVQALDEVSFSLFPGEVHCLVGENGAGKSTLMKILSGLYKPDSGSIHYNGEPIHFSSPREAIDLGICTIYQEFNLVPTLSAGENIFLGNEIFSKVPGLINRKTIFREAEKILEKLKIEIDVKKSVEFMSVAEHQIIEIAKALVHDSKVLIMDEPTAALTGREVDSLFEIICSLREHGTGIIYVSHRLEEVKRIADRITVLRDGRLVGTRLSSEIDAAEIIRMMIGRSMDRQYPFEKRKPGEAVLEVKDFSRQGIFEDVNLSLHRGEIVGLAGLVGAGRTELVRAIFGAEVATKGDMFVNGKCVQVRNPKSAIKQGIALVPEDRKNQGLVLSRSVRDNIVLASLSRLFKSLTIKYKSINAHSRNYITRLNISTPSVEQEVTYLSGGNQQKVVLAKWLLSESEIVIFDEPTRGIDVGAKLEIYNLMNQLARDGKAILMISSELPEVLGVCDRILVMRDGKLVGQLLHRDATEDKVMALATGVQKNE